MRILIDSHMHSEYSMDSRDSYETMCENAISKGLKAICFTEHYDNNCNAKGFNQFNANKYISRINELKHKYGEHLKILCGIEFGEPHIYKKEFNQTLNFDYDYILGSVHWIGSLSVRSNDESGNDIVSGMLIDEYYNEIEKMVEHKEIDAVAHLDLPKRYYAIEYNNTEKINSILIKMIVNNIALEVNTMTLRKGQQECLPSFEIIEKYIKYGGNRLTIGSDAHNARDIAADFKKAELILGDEYIKYLGIFINRKFVNQSKL